MNPKISRALGLIAWLCVGAIGVDALAKVPGETSASKALQRDVSRHVLTLDAVFADTACKHRKIVDTQVIEVHASGKSGVERWSVDRCGKLVDYRVTFSPSPRGGTDFQVQLDTKAGESATAPSGAAPVITEPVVPPAGTSWVMEERKSGAYGSGKARVVVRIRGPATWKEQHVIAVEFKRPKLPEVQYWTETGDIVAREFPFGTFEHKPPKVKIQWPLTVGKMWENRFKLRLGSKADKVTEWVIVARYGSVKTPAGTFDAFEIGTFDSNGRTRVIEWWSPKLGIIVKSREESLHCGGTSEEELVEFNPAQ